MTALWSRRTEWVILAIIIVVIASASGRKRSFSDRNVNGKPQDDIDDFVPYQGEKFSRFDWHLLQILAKNNKGNLLVSPISLKLALVLLYEGAQDETAQELATVMSLPVGISATRDRFSTVLKSLQEKNPDYTLNFGTRMYVDHSISLRQRYAAIATSFYNAEVLNTNFSDTQVTLKTVNDFVYNVTEGHIPKLITDGASLKDALMLVVNTLFFKGHWHRKFFSPNDTKVGPFNTGDKNIIQTPYMKASRKFYMVYAEELNAKILRLPYAGHKYSMFIILPQQSDKLDELIGKVSPYIMSKYMWLMQETDVDVMIPKFKFDFMSHLEKTLREMGIRDIFDESATLTGILKSRSTSRRLVVSDVVQKAGIEVNEEGSTAYTATEIEIVNKMSDETFHATHPFVFYIEDESTGTMLYMGVVNNPLEESGIAEDVPQTPVEEPPTRLDSSDNEKPAISGAVTGFEERYNYFNIELLQQLNEAEPGNVVVGTSSIKTALMVLAEAATGQTREQILSSLRIPSHNDELRKAAGFSLDHYKDPTGVTELESAIKLWLSKDVAFNKNYSDVLKSYYKSDIETVNFSDFQGTVNIINQWINKYTHGRITSLTDARSVSPNTKLLLTTSVYFKGAWVNAFNKSDTRKRCFNVPKIGCKDVMLMESVANYKYAYVYALDAEVILIPYTGGRIAMMAMLPRVSGIQALQDLSRDIAFTPIPSILSSLQESEVLLQLPRFSIKNKLNVQSVLSKLRIQDLFSEKANLSRAFLNGGVKVGGFMHNAQIEVNEEGTIATAVSEAAVIPLIGSSMPAFRADRPFLFFLLDLQTNGILFAGRYTQPEDEATPANAAKRN